MSRTSNDRDPEGVEAEEELGMKVEQVISKSSRQIRALECEWPKIPWERPKEAHKQWR